MTDESQNSSQQEYAVSTVEILLDKLRANLGHEQVHAFLTKVGKEGPQGSIFDFATEALREWHPTLEREY